MFYSLLQPGSGLKQRNENSLPFIHVQLEE